MAMLIMRTADNLRQIMSLRETHPEMAALATVARGAILREPVVF
jgi:ATP-dependent RNA helicase HelY